MTAQPDERFALIERKLLRWQLLTVVALLAAAGSFFTLVLPHAVPAEVRARAFLVVDQKGEVVARLEDASAGPLLLLRAARAGANVMVGSMNGDAGLAVVARGSESFISLAVGKEGYPAFSISGNKSKVLVGLDREESPAIVVRDHRGELAARPWGLKLRDGKGKIVFTTPDSSSTVSRP